MPWFPRDASRSIDGKQLMRLIKSVSGVRGTVQGETPAEITMTEEVARCMGQAYATYLRCSGRRAPGLVLVGGRDGRAGGEALYLAFTEGARSSGAHVVDVGIVSTPGVAMMVKAIGAAGGVVITASHNPAQWNGIKLITSEGSAPSMSAAKQIFEIFDSGAYCADAAAGAPPDLTIDPHEYHVREVLRLVDAARITERSFSVVLDSINGAGARAGHGG